ncbi:twin-arginine translocation signal domain-containing protein [Roseovarius sp.]|uniref:twin-arginine translocation signal domain-containing protein n=1 Tax=Roseovarius sp. TaxID=1486281 RepID=UPI00262DA58C|nr:twin-arginine translocation signal domain-containing protein [Roseovarius sp.]MDM8167144.1 twin-arginine translocation signal domain-containing protein [Roseovarius sp.]
MDVTTRRGFIKSASLTAATAAIPAAALAHQAPVTEATIEVPSHLKDLINDLRANATPYLGAADRYSVVRKEQLEALYEAVGEVEPKNDDEKIAHYAKEIIFLLNKTKPEGMKAFDQAFIVKGGVGAVALPPGYKPGQPYADYSHTGDGWKMKGGAA